MLDILEDLTLTKLAGVAWRGHIWTTREFAPVYVRAQADDRGSLLVNKFGDYRGCLDNRQDYQSVNTGWHRLYLRQSTSIQNISSQSLSFTFPSNAFSPTQLFPVQCQT
jgi:hypothetical protein